MPPIAYSYSSPMSPHPRPPTRLPVSPAAFHRNFEIPAKTAMPLGQLMAAEMKLAMPLARLHSPILGTAPATGIAPAISPAIPATKSAISPATSPATSATILAIQSATFPATALSPSGHTSGHRPALTPAFGTRKAPLFPPYPNHRYPHNENRCHTPATDAATIPATTAATFPSRGSSWQLSQSTSNSTSHKPTRMEVGS